MKIQFLLILVAALATNAGAETNTLVGVWVTASRKCGPTAPYPDQAHLYAFGTNGAYTTLIFSPTLQKTYGNDFDDLLSKPFGTYSISDGKLVLVTKYGRTNVMEFVLSGDMLTIDKELHFRQKETPNKGMNGTR